MAEQSVTKKLGFLDRYLTLWIQRRHFPESPIELVAPPCAVTKEHTA